MPEDCDRQFLSGVETAKLLKMAEAWILRSPFSQLSLNSSKTCVYGIIVVFPETMWLVSVKIRSILYSSLVLAYASIGSISLLSSEVLGTELTKSAQEVRSNQASYWLKEGGRLYQSGNYSLASSAWQKAASQFAEQKEILGQALALSNLATAHQRLGQLERSHQAIALSLSLLEDAATLSARSEYWQIYAKALNTKGNGKLRTGQLTAALATWKQATQYYQRAKDRSGIIRSKINQAKALHSLGLTIQALGLLKDVGQSLAKLPKSELKATGLRSLGRGLRNVGRLKDSEEILLQSVEVAETSQAIGLSWLEIGNTQTKIGDRARDIGKEANARAYYSQAIAAYDKAQTAIDDRTNINFIRPQLNQLSLSIKQNDLTAAIDLVDSLDRTMTNLAPSHGNIYAQLNYAQSLTCLQWSSAFKLNCGQSQPESELVSDSTSQAVSQANIITIINRAIAQSRSLKDTVTEAQAVGQLARVYELAGDLTKAQNLTQQALLLLEEVRAKDVAYSLEWQLGRILKQEGKKQEAIAMYRQAIASLEEVRTNLLFIDRTVQFSFRDRIEPVYRQYAELLLEHDGKSQPNQANLRQAVKAIDSLQLAELENFLGCELTDLVKLDETAVDPTAARIYPIVLSDRLATIMEIPGQPLYYAETEVSRSQIQAAAMALQDNLAQPGRTRNILQHSQAIYDWLFAPLESKLSDNSQVKTLIFVPDGDLRNVPLGVLYNGEKYLIENFAVAVAPRLKLFAPQTSSKSLKVFTGGVGIPQTIDNTEYPRINLVEQELRQIGNVTKTSNPLLNQEFTEANIQSQLESQDFSAIHWKTHGIFSSDPAETFLVAYQERIQSDELQLLVKSATNSGLNPLELLVLSACETAKSDRRAILGLAGITVRTGARSSLSTLWKADDRATTILMTKFYQQLSQSGITKAEALRQAQLSLIREEGYFAPHFWATYLLVGSWL